MFSTFNEANAIFKPFFFFPCRDDFRVDCPDFRIKLTRWGHRDPTKDSDREEWETGGESFDDF